MTRDDGVRTAEEILGGVWDYAVRARAAWLITEHGWDPDAQPFGDLTQYEAMQNSETMRRRAEHRRRMALASFSNAVTS